jgi:hypothetical protein
LVFGFWFLVFFGREREERRGRRGEERGRREGREEREEGARGEMEGKDEGGRRVCESLLVVGILYFLDDSWNPFAQIWMKRK